MSTSRHSSLRWFASLLTLAQLLACAPAMHTVKPLPNFVSVGLAPGDTVTVTTRAGTTHEFVIETIRGDVLVSADDEFALADLQDIKKHGGERPKSPCGGEKPLGCSVPLLVSLTSEVHAHYEDIFYDACAQHDYCYRHGFASYGQDRQTCDEEFLEDMLTLCPKGANSDLGRVLEVLSDSPDSRHSCELVADDYFGAVRRFGRERFETTNSTYCEYDGPPAVLRRAPLSQLPKETSR